MAAPAVAPKNVYLSKVKLVFVDEDAHVNWDNVVLCDPLPPFIRLQSITQSDFAGLPHTAGSI